MISRLLRRTSRKRKRPSIGMIFTMVMLIGVLLPITLFIIKNPGETQAAWFDGKWQYRKKITIDAAQVTGSTDLTNFTVLVSATDSSLGTYAQTDGDDIVFTDINGTKLDHEIASYTTGTGVLVAWVRVPTLYAAENTYLYMYYGNASASNQQNVAGAWSSDYMAVWHLDEVVTDEGTAASVHEDSTLQNYAMSQFGNDEIAGQVSNAQQLDGTDSLLRSSDTVLGMADGADRVFSGWFYRDGPTTDDTLFARKNAQGASAGYMMWIDDVNDDLNFDIYDGTDLYTINGSDAITTTGWHHFAVVWDDDNALNTKVYIDGLDDTQTRTGTLANINAVNATINFRIGAESDNGSTHTGRVDEYRMRSTTVTDDWILTEYNNQSAPGTFLSLGSVENSPAPVAFWKFDEGVDNTCTGGSNDACDSSGSVNDISKVAGTWARESDCVSGKCVSLDGNSQYFNKSDDSDFDFTGTESFTLTGWFRHGPQTIGEDVLLNKFSGGGEGGYRVQMEADGDISCSIDSDSTAFPSDSAISTTATYDDNKWHHFSCVKSGSSSLTLYIDGKQVGEDTSITSSTIANGDQMIVGSDEEGNSWAGFMDEVKIYRSAKTASEVKAEYAARGSNKGSSAVLGQTIDNTQRFLTEGLTGYWRMDEIAANTCTGGTNDSCDWSGNANNGAWNGNATTTANGRFGSGTTYDGTDDYADFGDPSSGVLDPGDESFTVSLWVKPTSNIGAFDMPLYKGGSSASNAGYDFELGSGGWNTSVSDGTANVVGSYTATSTTGTWAMLTAVIDRDSKNLILYMNGQQVDKDSIAALGAINSTRNLRLGVDHSSAFDFNGVIDELRIYKRALSPAEVNSLYNWGPGPNIYLKLDENTGTTTTFDSSGNGKNGTLNTFASTAWESGKYGSALNFDGSSDYITVASPALPTNDFTYETWLYLDDNTDEQFFMASDGTGSNIFTIYTDTYLELTINGTGYTLSDSTLPTNTWFHIAVTRSGGTLSFYRNGVLEIGAGGTNSTTMSFSTCDLVIGADVDSACTGTLNSFLDGKMDDVRIYNYARNAGQVIQDMNAGHPLGGSPVGSALGNWALDEQGGQTAFNQTNQYNMTLGSSSSSDTNDPTWLLESSCKINGCLDFDGTDNYTETPDDIALNMTDMDSLTISGWFYRDTFTTEDVIISKKAGQTAADTGYIVYIDDSTDDLTFEISDGTDEYMVEAITTNVTAVGWNHFAFVFDPTSATNIKAYYNGVEQRTTLTGTLANIGDATNALAVRLGAESDAGAPFDGRLDDIRIYKAALSSENIKVDYNANSSINFGTKSVEASTLIDGAGSNPNLYFNFDENNASASAQTLTLESTTHVATGSAATSGTIPHNTGNQSNRMLVVAVNAEDASATDIDVSSVTYNGRPLSLAIRREASSGNFGSVELWYLLNPPVGQYNVVTTFAGTVTNFAVAAQSFYNVRQDVPESTSQSTTGSGGATTQTLTTTVPNSMLIDTVMNLSVTSYTPGTSQTERYDATNAAHTSAGSTKLWAVPGSPTMSQTAASSTLQIHAAMAIAPAFNTTTIQDRSGSNLSGVLAGGMGSNSWSDGKYGSALKFDGTGNYATVATPGFPTSDFTVEGWVNTADTNGTIFQISDDDTLERDLAIAVGEDGVGGALTGYIDATKEVESTTLVNTSTWQHFAMTRAIGSGDVLLYINGVLESSGTNTTVLDIGTCSAIFGAHPQTTSAPCIGTPNSSFFAGSIDDFKVYNYVRTPAQIAYDFNRGKPIGWWKADECTGATAYDSSGHGNHGTMTIGATGTYTSTGTCTSGTATQSWNTGETGKINASFALDGTDDFVNIGDPSSGIYDFNATQSFTISSWFYHDDTGASVERIVAKRAGGSDPQLGYYLVILTTDIIRASIDDGVDTVNTNSSSTITNGTWNHVAWVVDRSTNTSKLYVNGNLEASASITAVGSTSNTSSFRIGSSSSTTTGAFDGKIDDVRVYNYALSDAQVKLVKNNNSQARFAPSEGMP